MPEFRPREVRATTGSVYFVEAVGLDTVKIGAARDVRYRIRQLQVGCPARLRLLLTLEGGKAKELMLHRKFEAHHVRGDWFRYADDLRDYVANHAKRNPNCMQN